MAEAQRTQRERKMRPLAARRFAAIFIYSLRSLYLSNSLCADIFYRCPRLSARFFKPVGLAGGKDEKRRDAEDHCCPNKKYL